ncbi:hypothetical protein QYF61_010849 [Mycteria americana]|uniref:Uncharacterized protein n=1 Tax=Mycteria americana TaxID=33587 RepID=A0AAN7N1K6_MYCAM|nr:hypothetical protein QYF61_010849 [Mycteria americana]
MRKNKKNNQPNHNIQSKHKKTLFFTVMVVKHWNGLPMEFARDIKENCVKFLYDQINCTLGSDRGALTVEDLHSGGENTAQLQPERGDRLCERNNSADTKVSEGGGGGGAPGARAEIPLQHVVKTVVMHLVPLQPIEVHGADIYLRPMEGPTPERVGVPKGGCDSGGSPRWSRLLGGPVTP